MIHIIKGTQTITLSGCGFDVEKGTLYYNSGSELIAYDIATGVRETVLNVNINDCTVLDDGLHKVILTTVYQGYASELVAYQFDGTTGSWSNGITLTDKGKYIRDYSAVMEADGKISAVINFVDIDEDSEKIYGNAELCVMDFAETEDLMIGDGAYYDEKLIAPGATLPLYFNVTINGWNAIEKFEVDILDESGTVIQSGEVSCGISPGDTVETSFNYKLPSIVQNQKLTIKVYTENETKFSDNMVQVEIGMEDIALDNLYIEGSETGAVLKGTVQNLGYKDAGDVEVTVYNWNMEEDVIGKEDIGTVQKQESREFEIIVPQTYLDVNPLSSGNVLYVTATSNMDELDYVNNTVQYLVKSSSDEPIVLNYRSLTMQKKEAKQLQVVYSSVTDLSESTVQWKSSNDSVVSVEDGKLTAVSSGEAVITATVGSYQAVCHVLVSDGVSVESVYLDEMSINILVGNTKQLSAHILPEDAANQKVIWESDSPSVATVSSDGIVKGVRVGSAIVTAYTEDGYKSVSCQITVSQQENQSYTAEFVGGEGVRGTKPTAITRRAGEIFALPENTLQKEGMLFAGWSDGTRSCQPGEYYKMSYHDMLFTALWSSGGKVEYIITASAQIGGTIEPDGVSTVSEGETIQYVITPNEGYAVNDVKVDGESIGAVMEYVFEDITANHTIEVWFKSIKKFTVVFDSQGGSLVNPVTGISSGETILLPVPTKDNFQFMGWYTEPNGKGTKFTEGTIVEFDMILCARFP